MDNVDLRGFDDDGFTIRLEGPPHLIAVETLVETLTGFAEAMKEINKVVNPGHELEVFVDSLSPGSFNIGVRLKQHVKQHRGKYTALVLSGAAFVGGMTHDVISQVLAGYITTHLNPDAEECDVRINMESGDVHVRGSHCNVTISRAAHEATKKVAKNKKVRAAVRRAIKAAQKDKVVESVGVVGKGPHAPEVHVARAQFSQLTGDHEGEVQGRVPFPMMSGDRLKLVPGSRTTIETASLTVLKVVFLRSRRKWQFIWRGITIPAPITDPDFFDRMEARSISLSQGDALEADLAISQRFVEEANVWENVSYAVVKVHSVKLGQTQVTMDFATPLVPYIPFGPRRLT